MRVQFVAAALIAAMSVGVVQAAAQSHAGKIVARVYVFTTTDCPIANRYAPEIKRLVERFQGDGIDFRLVYPVPSDSEAAIREHMKKFEYRLAFVRDTKLELVKRTGVTVTPEVAVEDAEGEILYRGRIDDRHVDFGKERPSPTSRDLENALNAVVAGTPVPVPETRAIGCYLSDLIK